MQAITAGVIWGILGALPLRDAAAESEPVLQSWPAATCDGRDACLVVWQEGSDIWGSRGTDIKGGWVKAASPHRIEALATPIAAAPDVQEHPAVAFGSGIFLVVWQDLRNGKDYDVYGARITANGSLLDPTGIRIAAGAHNQVMPSVAFAGSEFVVAWSDFADGGAYVVRLARVSPDGQVLSFGDGSFVARGDRHAVVPRLVSTQTGPWLFWNTVPRRNDIWGMALSDGQRHQVTPKALDHAARTAVATDGHNVMFAWILMQGKIADALNVVALVWNTQERSLAAPDPRGATVLQRGGRGQLREVFWVAGDGKVTPRTPAVESAAAAFDGRSFWVAWCSYPTAGQGGLFRILARRIDPRNWSYAEREPHVLAQDKWPLRRPWLASMGTGQILMVHESGSPEGVGTLRVGLVGVAGDAAR